nr:MAG TPA: hypothetical protein [Caudoviricetes sp.]
MYYVNRKTKTFLIFFELCKITTLPVVFSLYKKIKIIYNN